MVEEIWEENTGFVVPKIVLRFGEGVVSSLAVSTVQYHYMVDADWCVKWRNEIDCDVGKPLLVWKKKKVILFHCGVIDGCFCYFSNIADHEHKQMNVLRYVFMHEICSCNVIFYLCCNVVSEICI